jgi:hypothetical protein
MRSMPRLLRRLGLQLFASRTYAFFEIGRADFFVASLRSYPVLLPKAGVATLEEVRAFVDDQLRASAEGSFFGGYNFVSYLSRRPELDPAD